jgi:hypothetical protein
VIEEQGKRLGGGFNTKCSKSHKLRGKSQTKKEKMIKEKINQIVNFDLELSSEISTAKNIDIENNEVKTIVSNSNLIYEPKIAKKKIFSKHKKQLSEPLFCIIKNPINSPLSRLSNFSSKPLSKPKKQAFDYQKAKMATKNRIQKASFSFNTLEKSVT